MTLITGEHSESTSSFHGIFNRNWIGSEKSCLNKASGLDITVTTVASRRLGVEAWLILHPLETCSREVWEVGDMYLTFWANFLWVKHACDVSYVSCVWFPLLQEEFYWLVEYWVGRNEEPEYWNLFMLAFYFCLLLLIASKWQCDKRVVMILLAVLQTSV